MNIDIQTEHVRMRPEWHRMIDDWLQRCARCHPEVIGVEVNLRHAERGGRPEEAVDVVATARGRSFRETKQANVMTLALHDAFEALEQDLLVHEATGRAA